MEQGEKTPPYSLDEVFNGILNDQSLQEQVKQAQEQQAREQERIFGEPLKRIGRAYFVMLSHPDDVLPDDLKSIAGGLRSTTAIHEPDKRIDLSPEEYKKHYLERILENIDAVKNTPNKEQGEKGTRLAKHFLYGFGTAAIDDGDVTSALVTLNAGGWLDDEFEGPELQRKIAEKVSSLDPKAKVDAAMTWRSIQEAKVVAPPNPPVPPSSAPRP